MNEKKILLDAIKNAGLLTQTKFIWLVNPLLEDMALKFANYVGPYSLTKSGKSLLGYCLKQAVSQHKKENDRSGDVQAAAGAFARVLINHSQDVFSQQLVVETSSGDIVWSPFVCGADKFINKWAEYPMRNSRIESNISVSISSAFLMIQIMPHSLLDNESLAEFFPKNEKNF